MLIHNDITLKFGAIQTPGVVYPAMFIITRTPTEKGCLSYPIRVYEGYDVAFREFIAMIKDMKPEWADKYPNDILIAIIDSGGLVDHSNFRLEAQIQTQLQKEIISLYPIWCSSSHQTTQS